MTNRFRQLWYLYIILLLKTPQVTTKFEIYDINIKYAKKYNENILSYNRKLKVHGLYEKFDNLRFLWILITITK